MKQVEALKQRKDEALRGVEISMDRLRRAGRKNEKAASLHLEKKRPFLEIEAEDLFGKEQDSGLHELS